MPMMNDAKSGFLRFVKMMPQNGFLIWLAHKGAQAPSAKVPDTHELSWITIPRSDGTGQIRTMLLKPKAPSGPLPVVVHFHGGGYVSGTPQGNSLDRLLNLALAQDAIFVAPDYRLGTEAPFPAGHDDCYDTLIWATENADRLGGRPDQIVIGGESAGGGMCQAIALRARDEGRVNIAFQMPIYPMLDDREPKWTSIPNQDVSWSVPLNRYGWDKYLGGRHGSASVSPYAAPARAESLAGLPPTITFIGTLDLFLDETREMVRRMRDAGVPVDYREFEDVYHGQENLAPKSAISPAIHAHYRDRFAHFAHTCFAAQPKAAGNTATAPNQPANPTLAAPGNGSNLEKV